MKSKTKAAAILHLIFSLFAYLPEIYGAAGELDATFSQDGKIIEQYGGKASDYASSTAVQTDGKLVVAGKTAYGGAFGCGIVRYNPDGSLDTSFDGDGKAYVQVVRVWSCRDLAIQKDGKIVLVGMTGMDYSDAVSGDFAVARLNPDGSPDTTFDGDGKLIFRASEMMNMANSVAIQPDGKILIAGLSRRPPVGGWYVSDFTLVRLNPDGSPDAAFDGDGIVKTSFSGYEDIANDVALQVDGKIVVAGKSYFNTFADIALARYNPDGSLDESFDGDGKVVTPIDSAQSIAHAVEIQPDGKIVAAGKSQGLGSGTSNFILVRYNADGSPDSAFDGDGKVLTGLYTNFEREIGLAIQPDGKIAATTDYAVDHTNYSDFIVLRYNPNGSPDAGFDGDGRAITAVSNLEDYSAALALQADGKLVAAGYSNVDNQSDFALVRYNSNGSLDFTFTGDGVNSTDVSVDKSEARTVLTQPDGKILAVGGRSQSSGKFSVFRYNADGSRDLSFDGDGLAEPALADLVMFASDAALQADGKIIVAGVGQTLQSTGFALSRLNPDGSVDKTFNSDGRVLTPFPSGNAAAQSIAVQPDGKIVAAGHLMQNNMQYFALARYHADGSLDASFDGDGMLVTAVSERDGATAVEIQPDGKIVAVGTSAYLTAASVVRYNPDGSLDTSFDNDGKVLISLISMATSATIQPDGKILVGGSRHVSSDYDMALIRLNPNGSLDETFDSDGAVITRISNGSDTVESVMVQPDGKIIAAGYGNYNTGHSDFILVRYNTDGSLDAATYGTEGIARFDLFGGMDDFIYGATLDSSGRVIAAGQSNGFFTVARFLGDVQPVVNYSVGGRVVSGKSGVGNVIVALTDAHGEVQTTRTNTFGFYRFAVVPAGSAAIGVTSKRYTFETPNKTVEVAGNIGDVDFAANE